MYQRIPKKIHPIACLMITSIHLSFTFSPIIIVDVHGLSLTVWTCTCEVELIQSTRGLTRTTGSPEITGRVSTAWLGGHIKTLLQNTMDLVLIKILFK